MAKVYEDLHGIVMWGAWNIFGLLGILIAHFKFGKVWFNLHVVMMNIAVVLTIVGLIFIKQEEEREGEPFYLTFHKVVGTIVFIFIILQPINGFFRPDNESPRRKYWLYYHKYVGRIIVIITTVGMVLTGLRILDYEVDTLLFKLQLVYCGIVIVGFMTLEYLYNKDKKLDNQVEEAEVEADTV